MPETKLKALLRSILSRLEFAVSKSDGDVASELSEAIRETEECLALLSAPEIVPNGGKSILFIDDEDVIRNIASRMLSASGYSVLTAADGRSGMELFNKNAESIGCVIVDLVMPGMDGIKVADTIHSSHLRTGVILTSGYGEEEIKKRYGSLGPGEFMRKPFSSAMLREMVAGVMESDGGP